MTAPLKRSRADWDLFYLGLARYVGASRSKDPRRRVGACLVTPDRRQLSIGYNGLPATVPDDPALLADREQKLALMVHAEDNCLRQSPVPPEGCTLYVTLFPCLACGGLIAEAGVARVVAPRPTREGSRWASDWMLTQALFGAAGVATCFEEDLLVLEGRPAQWQPGS